MRGGEGIILRLRWLEDRIYWTGALGRAELSRRFGVSITQASHDISEYARLAPGNIVMNSAKRYVASEAFVPVFPKCARSFMDDAAALPLKVERTPDPWLGVDHGVLAALVSASVAGRPISVETPTGRTALCPHCIVDEGPTLLLRGWSHASGSEEVWRLSDLASPASVADLPWVAASSDRAAEVRP